jgi:hypothetical protein
MLTRILSIALGVAILIAFAAPFARDAYHRYEVSRRLDTVMDDRDRAALAHWHGDAASFGRALFERCEREQGAGAPACNRYKFAFNK